VLVKLAEDVARRAGALLLEGVDRRRTRVETKSTATDMVSEMDRAAEDLIVGALLATRPDDGIVAEEGSARAGTSGVRWVIDPLDGTTNYLYRLPGWGVSVAAERDGEVVAGAVLDAVHDEMFTATQGGGAWRNGDRIAASAQDVLALALVGTGFGYDPERRRAQAAILTGLLPDVRDIRRAGAAAVDLCSVACGRLDAFYERGLGWWDMAAGGLIAAEAGAAVTTLQGGAATTDTLLAASPHIIGALRGRLSALRAEDVP
jgi:myo-inositol-1(or 4)-monophosphatase